MRRLDFIILLGGMTIVWSHVSANPSSLSVKCAPPSDLTHLDYPLTRTAKRVTGGDPIKLVAIGSSSTAGAGASSPAASYPSRLLVELQISYPLQILDQLALLRIAEVQLEVRIVGVQPSSNVAKRLSSCPLIVHCSPIVIASGGS